MERRPFRVSTPVHLPSGKTSWVQVGVAWPSHESDRDRTYVMSLSLTALPLGAFQASTLELYVFPPDKEP